MAILLQALTLAGKVIDEGRWHCKFEAGVQEGHSIALNLPIEKEDAGLVAYLMKAASTDAMLDKSDDGYSVALSCRVARVRHMVEASGKVETMAFIAPTNRLVEHVLTYLLSPSKCDPKFVRAIRSDLSSP